MGVGSRAAFVVNASDFYRRPVSVAPTWTSSDTNIATIDAATGVVAANNAGDVIITANVAG